MIAVLFPVMKDELGVGYAALGATTALFYTVSGVFQTLAGFGDEPRALWHDAVLEVAPERDRQFPRQGDRIRCGACAGPRRRSAPDTTG